jgi:hypothetical protein
MSSYISYTCTICNRSLMRHRRKLVIELVNVILLSNIKTHKRGEEVFHNSIVDWLEQEKQGKLIFF